MSLSDHDARLVDEYVWQHFGVEPPAFTVEAARTTRWPDEPDTPGVTDVRGTLPCEVREEQARGHARV